jgi:hypothetical protein
MPGQLVHHGLGRGRARLVAGSAITQSSVPSDLVTRDKDR